MNFHCYFQGTCCDTDECNKGRFIPGTNQVTTTTFPVSVTGPVQVTTVTPPVSVTGTSQVTSIATLVPITANSKNYLKYYEYIIFSFQHITIFNLKANQEVV